MNDYYNDVELSLQETVDAIREGQKKKYFHLKSKDYWIREGQKGVEKKEEEKRLKREKAAQVRAIKQRE